MWIKVANLRIWYEVWGQGTPLLLLHGWGGTGESFRPLSRTLGSNYRLLALDLPGFGRSSLPPTAWGSYDYARLVLQFLSKLGLERVHLLGHSFGGRIGLILGAHHPEVLQKLILVDSAGIKPPASIKSQTIRMLKKSPLGRILKQSEEDPQQNKLFINLLEALRKHLGSNDYRQSGPLRPTLVKVVNEDLQPILPKISCSTLLIWGENDPVTPLEDARIMEAHIPKAKLVVLPGAGHFSYLDKFPEFSRNVAAFLEEN